MGGSRLLQVGLRGKGCHDFEAVVGGHGIANQINAFGRSHHLLLANNLDSQIAGALAFRPAGLNLPTDEL